MGRRKRQAVESGNTRQQLTRSVQARSLCFFLTRIAIYLREQADGSFICYRRCKDSSGPADVADPNDAGKSGTTMSSSTRSKRNPRRGAKGKWDEEKLMTSTKSELINLDLVVCDCSCGVCECFYPGESCGD